MVQNISCKSLFLNSPYIANCISPLQIELVLYLFVHLNVGIEMIGKFTINLAVSRLIPFVFFCIFMFCEPYSDFFMKYVSLQNLVQRNEQLYGSGDAPSGGVALPFILVQVKRNASSSSYIGLENNCITMFECQCSDLAKIPFCCFKTRTF